MAGETTLDAVRQAIDSIDDAIQDLIVRRTELVEDVRRLKEDWRVKIQPSREAEIVYRLIDRHRGPFPKQELVAIWRLLITATLSFEGPFSVAVYMPSPDSGYWDLGRDQYGQFTPMTRHGSVRSVIEAVHRQEATVGVLPMPSHDDADPWWRHLMTSQPEAPRIIARLPFAGPGNGRGGDLEALVICPVTVKPTGRDRSFLAIESEKRLGLNQFSTALAEVELPPTFATVCRDEGGLRTWLYLAEVEGFLTAEDKRIAQFRNALGKPLKQALLLGGYALPLSAEQLGLPASGRGTATAAKRAAAQDRAPT
ncbi:MAG: chorismate mutase [Rhodospirillales bacterium]